MTNKPTPDLIRDAYESGYRAGQKRKRREITAESRHREQQAFLDRVYLEILPIVLNGDGWTVGGRKVVSCSDRVALAADIAREASKKRPICD